MYISFKRARVHPSKMAALITEWCYGTPAAVCARKVHLNRNTVDLWYHKIQAKILALPPPPPFTGAVEIDECYFGKKPFGMQGTGMVGKMAVFGIRSRITGQVRITIIPGVTSQASLIPVIREQVAPGTTIYSDGFGAYVPLKALGYIHHVVYHAHTFTTRGNVHTNGIESFWRFTRHFLRSRRTIGRNILPQYLSEAVFRFNTRPLPKLRKAVRKLLRDE
jgi:transposase-like protein